MVYLLALIAGGLPLYLIRFKILGIPTTALEVFIYFTVVVYLLRVFSGQEKFQITYSRLLIPISLFLIAGLISTAIAPDKRVALGQLKAFFIDPILVFLLIRNLAFRIKHSKLISNGLILGGVFVASHAIWQKLTGQVGVDGRVIGIFGYSPNYLAMYLAPILVIGFGQLLNLKSKIRNFLTLIGFFSLCLLLLLALYFSGSRGGWLAIGAGFLATCYLLLINRWVQLKRLIMVITGVIAISGLVLTWQLAKPDFQPQASGRAATSNNIRWEIWKTSLQMGIENPILGIGLGDFQKKFGQFTKERVNYPEYITPQALTPHNLYLAIWLNLGILGVITFLWIIWETFKSQISKDPQLYALRSILYASLVAILAFGLVDTPYFKNDLSVMFWILIGLLNVAR